MTHEWWERVLPQCDAFISPIVLEEIALGDPDAAQRRQQSIAAFSIVEIVPEVHALAAAYFAGIPLPDKAQTPITWHSRLGMGSITSYRGIVLTSSVAASVW